MTIKYKNYTKGDTVTLTSLMHELGYSVDPKVLQNNIEEISKRGGVVLIAEKMQQILGCVSVVIDVRLAEGVYAEIVSLVVSKQSRGQGLGKELVQQAQAWAKSRVSKIRVRANEVRSEAHGFYESQGFREIKTQKVFVKTL